MRCAAFLFALTVLFAGCDSGPPTGEVGGTASFEGVPIADGTINFYPVDGKGGTAGGKIEGGKYSVDKVPVGTMRVQITSKQEAGKKKLYNTPNSPEQMMYKDPLPAKYNDPLNSELRLDVQAGKNQKDWALK